MWLEHIESNFPSGKIQPYNNRKTQNLTAIRMEKQSVIHWKEMNTLYIVWSLRNLLLKFDSLCKCHNIWIRPRIVLSIVWQAHSPILLLLYVHFGLKWKIYKFKDVHDPNLFWCLCMSHLHIHLRLLYCASIWSPPSKSVWCFVFSSHMHQNRIITLL